MTQFPFDTLQMAQRFESAGFSKEQAKVLVAVLAELIGTLDANAVDRLSSDRLSSNRLSSNQGLALELAAIRSDINASWKKIETTSTATTSELVRWVAGVGLLQMALIIGLALALTH